MDPRNSGELEKVMSRMEARLAEMDCNSREHAMNVAEISRHPRRWIRNRRLHGRNALLMERTRNLLDLNAADWEILHRGAGT